MHQCEVIPAAENGEGSSLDMENKGAGEDVSTANNAVVTAAVSTTPGLLLLFTCS